MKIAPFIAALRNTGEKNGYECPATCDGCDMYRAYMDSERYSIDFAEDFQTEGWEQFDTDQDAHYFGVWFNREQFLTLTYAEGDWSLIECHDAERYNHEVRRAIDFYGEGYIAKAMDDGGQWTTYKQNRSRFLITQGGEA